MFKKFSLIVFLLANVLVIKAQQFSAKNLIGRWQNTRIKDNNVVFFNESTGAFLISDGMIIDKINYKINADTDVIELKTTTQIESRKPRYVVYYYKMINDSVIMSRAGKPIPKNADTSSKEVNVFKRIKQELPGTAIHLPASKDLLGRWKYIGLSKIQWELNFINDSTVYQTTKREGAKTLKYIIDFNKQPTTINMYSGKELVEEGLLRFYNKDIIHIQYFYLGKLTDHIKNFMLTGVKALIPLERQMPVTK
jgi:hypothetical protein